MKKYVVTIIFLLLIISVNAQNGKSQFNITVDSINAILKANPLTYYTDNKQNSAFIKKISANEQGIVTFTDSIPKSVINKKEPVLACCPPKRIRTLNVFTIKKWEIIFPIAYLKDKNKEIYGRIIGLQKEDLYKLKEQFDKLTVLSKKETKTKL
jgi:hypothetical protein